MREKGNKNEQGAHQSQNSKTVFFGIFLFLLLLSIASNAFGDDPISLAGFPSSFVFFVALQLALSCAMAAFAKYCWKDDEEAA